MEDDIPLAIPLFRTSPQSQANDAIPGPLVATPAATDDVVNGNSDGQPEPVGITMITGYLGAGKTTVSETISLCLMFIVARELMWKRLYSPVSRILGRLLCS